MIYTRFGCPVNLKTARMVHEQDSRGYWFVQYYVTAEQSGLFPDGSGSIGRPIIDGQEFSAAMELRADEGWTEIVEAIHALLPEDEEAA